MSVYAQIYDIVAENLQQADETFEYRKSTFLCDIETHPQVVNVSKYLKLPNDEFVEAIYVAALKRLPDERTVAFWKQKNQMSAEKFQMEVLRCVEKSSVVAINQIYFTNNPFFVQKRGIKFHVLGMLYGLTDKSFLREVGKKMPAPIQKIIRKVFL